ncbi:hypothetical protein LOK49_LG11G02348 [Camellia lanceoleosa]|uniref:Uncharacterized protein n=1 Tax=Camellia lanceoleosa TaxID=1840588 RepID=A0ACC0G2F0_9ERIC|nr:hypothetical protein LOK49_LG11G02348 [Camellia lanceoleosa]
MFGLSKEAYRFHHKHLRCEGCAKIQAQVGTAEEYNNGERSGMVSDTEDVQIKDVHETKEVDKTLPQKILAFEAALKDAQMKIQALEGALEDTKVALQGLVQQIEEMKKWIHWQVEV